MHTWEQDHFAQTDLERTDVLAECWLYGSNVVRPSKNGQGSTTAYTQSAMKPTLTIIAMTRGSR